MMRLLRYRATGSNPGGSEQGRPPVTPPRAHPPRRRRLGVAIGAGTSACWLAGAQAPGVAAVFQPRNGSELQTAVDCLIRCYSCAREEEYGDISEWDTSLVTDM